MCRTSPDSYLEFIVYFRELGENLTDEELHVMIDEFDRDGDRSSEFLKLLVEHRCICTDLSASCYFVVCFEEFVSIMNDVT